jgi:hypothetical protein
MKKRIALHLMMLAGATAVFTAMAVDKLLPEAPAPSAAINSAP